MLCQEMQVYTLHIHNNVREGSAFKLCVPGVLLSPKMTYNSDWTICREWLNAIFIRCRLIIGRAPSYYVWKAYSKTWPGLKFDLAPNFGLVPNFASLNFFGTSDFKFFFYFSFSYIYIKLLLIFLDIKNSMVFLNVNGIIIWKNIWPTVLILN